MNNSFNAKEEIRVCARCGKMFCYTGMGHSICDQCKKEDEADFNLVKDYIYDHPSAAIMEVSKETGVRVNRIKAYLRDGKLMITDASPIFLNCESCGASIRYGRMCRECANTLSTEIKKEMNIDEYQIGEKPQNTNLAKIKFLNQ